MHHGKNLQEHGKNLQIDLFGTHQISIPSANFCLTPPPLGLGLILVQHEVSGHSLMQICSLRSVK